MRKNSALLKDLFENPQNYSFVQVTRILHHFYGRTLRYGQFLTNYVRIMPHLSLAFPTHDVVSLHYIDFNGNVLPEEPEGEVPYFLVTVNMLGLYGTSSPLPTFYTEELLAEAREDLSGIRDFLAILNARFYDLFLRAGWFRYAPMRAILEQGDYALGEKALALGGLPLSCNDNLPYSIEHFLPLIGLLSLFPRSAKGLESYLKVCLDCDCSITECVAGSDPIPPDQQCRLGMGSCTLGDDTLLGSLKENTSGHIKLTLHNMTETQLLRYSTSKGRMQLYNSINFYCTEPFNVDMEFELDMEHFHSVRLGRKGEMPAETPEFLVDDFSDDYKKNSLFFAHNEDLKRVPANRNEINLNEVALDEIDSDGIQNASQDATQGISEYAAHLAVCRDSHPGAQSVAQSACRQLCFLGLNTWLGSESVQLAAGRETDHNEGPGIHFIRGTRWADQLQKQGRT